MKRNRRPKPRPALSPREPAPKLTSGSEGAGGRIANRPLADPTTGRHGPSDGDPNVHDGSSTKPAKSPRIPAGGSTAPTPKAGRARVRIVSSGLPGLGKRR